MPTNFTTPPMRFVQGDIFEPSLTDQQGQPRVWPVGSPKAGQPRPQWFMALAIAKTDPAWPAFKALLDAESAADWPSLFPEGAGGPCVLPTFSNKIVDGDAYDTTGKSNAGKGGHAGHWVVRFTSDYAPKAYREASPGVFVEVTDPAEIKRGYYVRIAGSTKSNETATRPGIKVYHNMVQLFAKGEEILSGPSAADAFGGAPAAVPAGAQPLAAPTAPQPVAGAPAAPLPPVTPPAPPAAPLPPAAPYTGHMHDPMAAALADGWAAHPAAPGHFYKGQDVKAQADLGALYPAALAPPAPPLAPAAPPPPPAAGPTMTAKAAGQTRETLIAAGWTDELLIQHGYMIA